MAFWEEKQELEDREIELAGSKEMRNNGKICHETNV